MGRRAAIRASDNDRETVAERLRRAAHEGRLSTDELEHRLGRAFNAATYGELDEITLDLPVPRLPVSGATARPPVRRRGVGPLAVTVAVATVAVVLISVVMLAAIALAASMWFGWMLVAWLLLGHRHGPRRGDRRRGDRSRRPGSIAPHRQGFTH